MYTITTFVADHIPTHYKKPLGGGADLAIGTETVVEYETFDDCKAQIVSYSQSMETEKAIRIKKANGMASDKELKIRKANGTLVKPDPIIWTSHKMYREAKLPSLLHYIDNNYPAITMPSKP